MPRHVQSQFCLKRYIYASQIESSTSFFNEGFEHRTGQEFHAANNAMRTNSLMQAGILSRFYYL